MVSTLNRGKLLLCEDDQSMREFWSMFFREEGWIVTCCASPEEAFQVLQDDSSEFHFGYFDVQYIGSKYCGFDIARCVSMSARPFPFYIMSMVDTGNRQTEAIQAGAIGFVEKNFDAMLCSYHRFEMQNEESALSVSSRDTACLFQ